MRQKRHKPEEIIRLLRECDASDLSQVKVLLGKTDFGSDFESLAKEVWIDE